MSVQWKRLLRKLAQLGGEDIYYYQRYLDIHRNTPFSRGRPIFQRTFPFAGPTAHVHVRAPEPEPHELTRVIPREEIERIKEIVKRAPKQKTLPFPTSRRATSPTVKATAIGTKIKKLPVKQITQKAAKTPLKTLGRTTGKAFTRSWFRAHGPAMLLGAGLGLLLSKILGD